MESQQQSVVELAEYKFEHNSLVELGFENQSTKLQLLDHSNDLQFQFYYGGNKVSTQVFDEQQYKYKHFMKVPVKVDTTKMVMSPMPGQMVSISVEAGQTVVDG